MKYYTTHFKIECNSDILQTARDLVADMAGEVGFESFEDTDDGIIGYIQKELFDKNSIESHLADFPIQDVKISYIVSDVEDKDWNKEWEDTGFSPIEIDDKIIVYDVKHTATPPSNTDMISIGIEPIQSFGTGTHNTTRMMLSALANIDLKDKNVLDAGCGTGILAIAASKLGAKSVTGYDIDEWSVQNTQHNMEINGISNIEVLQGNSGVLSHVNGEFDVVLANINRNILINDMETFKSVTSVNATIIISGFYQADVPMLTDKAKECNLNLVDCRYDEEWACMIFHV